MVGGDGEEGDGQCACLVSSSELYRPQFTFSCIDLGR